MTKFHINPETGDVNPCSAQIQCRYTENGVVPEHYENKEDAQKAAEQLLVEKVGGNSSLTKNKEFTRKEMMSFNHTKHNIPLSAYQEELKKAERELQKMAHESDEAKRNKQLDINALKSNIADLDIAYRENQRKLSQIAPYSDLVKDSSTLKVLTHPQGKVAIVSDTGVKVFKNGQEVNSSLNKNYDKIVNGEKVGTWSEVDVSSIKNNNATTSSTLNPDQTRINAVINAGYPTTTHFNPTAKNLKFNESRISRNSKRAIFKTDESFNPHDKKSFANSELYQSWKNDADGTTVEVWQNLDSGRHLMASTSGLDSDEIGTKGSFSADQTGRPIGQSWAKIGAFEFKEGGDIVGEVPNKKMNFYVYK